MFKVLVDKCQLLHTLIEEFRVVVDSALDQFKRKLLLFLVYMMPRALLLQAQLPSILMPLVVSNHMEVVFSMAPVDSITTLSQLLVGDPLVQASTGLLETHGVPVGVSLVTSELLSTATAELHGTPTPLLLDQGITSKLTVISHFYSYFVTICSL